MKSIAGWLILATVVIWVSIDIFLYLHYGNSATESATLFRWSFRAPGISFLAGMLAGHLFFPQTQVVDELLKKK